MAPPYGPPKYSGTCSSGWQGGGRNPWRVKARGFLLSLARRLGDALGRGSDRKPYEAALMRRNLERFTSRHSEPPLLGRFDAYPKEGVR